MNRWGYKLIPPGEAEPDTPAPRRSVYAAILTEFLEEPHQRMLVQYGDRKAQAINMGLRLAKKSDPAFADIRIVLQGNKDTGQVYLEK